MRSWRWPRLRGQAGVGSARFRRPLRRGATARSKQAIAPRPDRSFASSRRSSPPAAASPGSRRLPAGTAPTAPEELFARAEAAGLSERLSRAIQRKALRTVGAWTRAARRLRLSINLLPRDLDRAGLRAMAARRNRRRRARARAGHRRDRRKQPAGRPARRSRRGSPACAPRACGSRSTISAPAIPASPI